MSMPSLLAARGAAQSHGRQTGYPTKGIDWAVHYGGSRSLPWGRTHYRGGRARGVWHLVL